jgi:hypothetical protein
MPNRNVLKKTVLEVVKKPSVVQTFFATTSYAKPQRFKKDGIIAAVVIRLRRI